MSPDHGSRAAFAELRRALVRRRVAQFDMWMRLEIVLIATLIGGFLFWQARIPFDGIKRSHGALAVIRTLGGILALLAVSGAALVANRHRRLLLARTLGPPWLALPLEGREILRHLAWESRLQALWIVALAPGFVIAAIGLVPGALLAGEALAYLVLADLLGRLVTWIVSASALREVHSSAGERDPALVLLARVATAPRARPRTRAELRRRAPWQAVCAKDLMLVRHDPAVRGRAFSTLALFAASIACWFLPVEPEAARVFAFGTALVAATAFAELVIVASSADPYPVLRGLPVGARTLWGARAVWALGASAALVVGHALAARVALGPEAVRVLLVWIGAASLAIGLLGVHYGMTLFGRPSAALRFMTLALGISVTASLMIPLLGWLVLLTAVLHSARRVPRWSWQEPPE